jgi:hypothetical protein
MGCRPYHLLAMERLMIVTEEEARTKRCQEGYAASDGVTDGDSVYRQTIQTMPAPLTSFSAGSAVAATVVTLATAPMHCIGPACMAWRRRWRIAKADGSPQNDMIFSAEPKGLIDGLVSQAVGYCGKAGAL